MKSKDFSARKYWLSLLSGFTSLIRIPSDFYPKTVTNSRDKVFLDLDDIYKEKLQKYTEKNSLSIESVIDTVYSMVMQKYSYEDDVVIGKGVEAYPLRIRFDKNYRFSDLAALVQSQWESSKEYTFYYMPDVIKKTSLKKLLINSVVIYRDSLDEKISFPNIDKYDFFIVVTTGEKLNIEANFRTDIYSDLTGKRVLKLMEILLKQVVDNDDIKVDEFELVDDNDRDIILNEFNDNDYEFDRNVSFVDKFREAAKKYPDRICVSDCTREMNYRDVDMYTDKIAAYLVKKGVKNEDTVAVILDRTVLVPISLIAIMKSGGTLFPIDKTNPPQRLRYLLEDSRAKYIVTCKSLIDSLEDYSDKELICIDDEALFDNCGNLDYDYIRNLKLSPKSCAYRISTSGSTGRPKCISIEQQSLMNMCYYSIDYINAVKEDVCGVYLSFSFDAVIKQIFPYLMIGASVNIIPGRFRTDEFTLNEYCKDKNVSILALPAIFGKLFIKNCKDSSIRVLQAGGDRLKGYVKREYDIINEYGPAEFTVISTSFKVDRPYEVIPVGKTIYNTKAYILDKNNKICPVGVPGELCLSGVQIARGYFNKPELNDISFGMNPFAKDEDTQHLYRTGDMCRWLDDEGNIDMIGRMDSQVKIDGIRIELFEIEYLINVLPGIKSSACIVRENEDNKYIEAFVAPYDEDYDVEEVSKYLKKRLPKYMIPSHITKLCAIPVTPIGKVDKKALPKRDE